MKIGVDLLQTYMYTLFVQYSWDFYSSLLSSNPQSTGNSEDRVSKSTGDLIRKIPQSKDCCFIEKNESFQLDCNVRNPCSKGACELKQQIICHG